MNDTEYIAEANRLNDADPMRFAAQATDKAWSAISGNCGGCGDESCHPGELCREVEHWVFGRVCAYCQIRHDQGLHRLECCCGTRSAMEDARRAGHKAAEAKREVRP